MRNSLAALAVLAVAGCGGSEPEQVVAVNLGDQLSPGCYTVDLFDPFTIEPPAPEVAQEAQKFLGVWKNGAWNGKWCHDLYITRVDADGSVVVLDAYGPFSAAGLEATVFRRQGTLKDGVLTLHSRGGTVKYQREGDYLVGTRKGTLGKMEITMSREENVAIGEPVMLKRAVTKS
jgi:hypothetical protein